MIKTLEATTQLGGFNQHLPMRQYNKRFPYSEPQQNEDDAIDTFFYSVKAHDDTIAVELIVGTKELLMNVYDKGSKSGLNIAKVLQDRLINSGITIKI